jgi:muconolactone delta-isomerase
MYACAMKLLALERPVAGVAKESFTPELMRTEARRAWELHQAGAIRELYFRADREEAVLVLEAADVAEARKTLGELPLVRARLIDFDLVPLRSYPGFARLFRG